jgi:hypothetical protein
LSGSLPVGERRNIVIKVSFPALKLQYGESLIRRGYV